MPEVMLMVTLGEFREACRQAGLDPDSKEGRHGCIAFLGIWDEEANEVLVPTNHPATAYLSDAAVAVTVY